MKEFVCYDDKGRQIEDFAQWDKNITVYFSSDLITEAPVVHIFNKNSKVSFTEDATVSGNKYAVKIPNELFKESLSIFLMIWVNQGTDGKRTIMRCVIPVKPKPEPKGNVHPEDDDWITIQELQAEINTLKAQLNNLGDLSVNFTTPSEFTNLQSGDNLSVLFGKIQAYIDAEITQPDIDAVFNA